MTDTWDAKVLEGVPRLHPWHNEDAYIKEADALAAIARMGAGDGLAEQATAALEGVTEGEWGTHHHDNYSEVAAYQPTFNSVCDVHMAADANFIAFTRQWVPEAAAHIAALTAQVKALQDDLNGMASEGRRMRGEYNIAADHLAKAEAERDALRERVARLEGALVEHNDLLRSALSIAKREGVDGEIASTNWDAYYNRVAVVLKRHHQTANDARAALTDGGKDE